jgi:hypothetical protein
MQGYHDYANLPDPNPIHPDPELERLFMAAYAPGATDAEIEAYCTFLGFEGSIDPFDHIRYLQLAEECHDARTWD